LNARKKVIATISAMLRASARESVVSSTIAGSF